METGTNKYKMPSQILTPQDFVSQLPGDDLFEPIYVDMQATFPPDPYAMLRKAQGIPYTDMRYGYQGRDAFKEFKHDVYQAQSYEPE